VARLIDSDGRLFGRLNLVDAAIAAFVIVLVPLAYASYLLFRPPAPTITSVEPATLTITEERAAQGTRLAGKVKVRGTGLRPVFRAMIGSTDAIAYIFENPTSADVLFGEVPSGTHDLILYDGVHEVARATGVITVPDRAEPSTVWVGAVGTLLDLDETIAAQLREGATYPPGESASAEILALDSPEAAKATVDVSAEVPVQGRQQRRALIAFRCEVVPLQPHECRTNGDRVSGGTTLVLPGTAGPVRFLVDTLVPRTPPAKARLRVRLYGPGEVLALVREGDVDMPVRAIDQRGAVVVSTGTPRPGGGEIALLLPEAASVLMADSANLGSLEAALTAGLDRGTAGWRYRGTPVRAGGTFRLTTRTYTLQGVVLSIDVEEPPPSDQR
jgi:hypothetical protein